MNERNLRMPYLNRTQIAGYLTRDAESKTTQSGAHTTRLNVAVNKVTGTGDARKTTTLFMACTAWDKLAQRCETLTKGRAVIIEGELKPEEWTDKTTGELRKAISLTAYDVKPLDWGDDTAQTTNAAPRATQAAPAASMGAGHVAPDDDIPF